MAYYGINFRSTVGYATDGTGESFVNGSEVTATTLGNGVTAQFSNDISTNSRNRNSAYDRRLAGSIYWLSAGTRTCSITPPDGAGTYRVWISLGDATQGPGATQAVLKDSGTTRATVSGTFTTNAFVGMNGTAYSSATWAGSAGNPSGTAYQDLLFSSGVITLEWSNGSRITHIGFEKQPDPAPTFTGAIGTQIGTQGVALAAQSPTIASYFSGTGITYTVSTALPTGLSIDGSTGVISGTPSTDTDWSGTVTATNGGGAISSNTFAITIAAASSPVAFTGTVPAQSGTVGTAYTTLALASYFSGSFTPYTYSVFSGALPGGLSLNTSTGEITGTPTTAGSFSAVVRATDTATNTANTGTISWTIAAAAATSMTVTLKQSDGTTAAASVTGIEYAILNASTLGAATAVLDTGTGESTDGSGNLMLDITGLGLVVGDVRYVVTGKSGGTVGADFDGWHGPAVAA